MYSYENAWKHLQMPLKGVTFLQIITLPGVGWGFELSRERGWAKRENKHGAGVEYSTLKPSKSLTNGYFYNLFSQCCYQYRDEVLLGRLTIIIWPLGKLRLKQNMEWVSRPFQFVSSFNRIGSTSCSAFDLCNIFNWRANDLTCNGCSFL